MSICRNLYSPVLLCQKRPIILVLRIEVIAASHGAGFLYIVVNKVGAFVLVSSATASRDTR
jgi:hypothetical protein